MSLVASPERNSVTRNEFYAFLALIACGQKNMGKIIDITAKLALI